MGNPSSFSQPPVSSLYGRTTTGGNPLGWGGPQMRWGSADPMQNMEYAKANMPGMPYSYQNTAQALYGTPFSSNPLQYGRWNWISPMSAPGNPQNPSGTPPGQPPGQPPVTQPPVVQPPGNTAPPSTPPGTPPVVTPPPGSGTPTPGAGIGDIGGFGTNARPGGTIGGPTGPVQQGPGQNRLGLTPEERQARSRAARDQSIAMGQYGNFSGIGSTDWGAAVRALRGG